MCRYLIFSNNRRLFFNKLLLITVLFSFFTILVYAPLSWALNGPHAWCSIEDPCGVCHIPHHAADQLLWARTPGEKFTGIKRLCNTCHGTHLFGAKDYFFLQESYDHPMGHGASIQGPGVTKKDRENIPLKPSEGGDGFYCGSCHNPHQDPFYIDATNSGDYLREFSVGLIRNQANKHYEFCIQCHASLIRGKADGHGSTDGCFDCHTPHYAPNPGKKIIVTLNIPFQALPNVPGFSDQIAGSYAAGCYGCHKDQSMNSGSLKAPLNGDDCRPAYEHHPMGRGADASIDGHQKTIAGPLSTQGELYCGSCHNPHDGTHDKYLNPLVIKDYDTNHPGVFCVACHSDKRVSDLGPGERGHNQIGTDSECLFCHSIHKSPHDPDAVYQTDSSYANQDNASASVDVIMRIKPVNLKWSDQEMDTDIRDYEDMCYGCHSNEEIVGRKDTRNIENSLLFDNVKDRYYSHRFNVIPSHNIKINYTFDDGYPVVSDGEESVCKNDYGVEKDKIWCGSCHNVHKQDTPPSYYSEEMRDRRTAYLRTSNENSDLCVSCHSDHPLCYPPHLTGGNCESHPVNVSLDQKKIKLSSNFLDYVKGGYSGGIGGQTSDDTLRGNITCQSCHNVHAAETSWHGVSRNGSIDAGILLIMDNAKGAIFKEQKYKDGSGLCFNCHNDTW